MKGLLALVLTCSFVPSLAFSKDNSQIIDEETRRVFHEIKYVKDEGDVWSLPETTLRRKAGDCEDMAILLKSRLDRKGIHTRFVGGKLGPKYTSGHAWLEYTDETGEVYVLDASAGSVYYRRGLPTSFYVPFNESGDYTPYMNKKAIELNSLAGEDIL